LPRTRVVLDPTEISCSGSQIDRPIIQIRGCVRKRLGDIFVGKARILPFQLLAIWVKRECFEHSTDGQSSASDAWLPVDHGRVNRDSIKFHFAAR